VDAALGPFVIRLERQDIGIGGIMGTLESSMLIKYPQSVYKSVYGTVEPFDLEACKYKTYVVLSYGTSSFI
jgi:hypothetical protein